MHAYALTPATRTVSSISNFHVSTRIFMFLLVYIIHTALYRNNSTGAVIGLLGHDGWLRGASEVHGGNTSIHVIHRLM